MQYVYWLVNAKLVCIHLFVKLITVQHRHMYPTNELPIMYTRSRPIGNITKRERSLDLGEFRGGVAWTCLVQCVTALQCSTQERSMFTSGCAAS